MEWAPGPRRPLGVLALCASTFFIVSGGPYGLEEIVSAHGYRRTLVLLAVVPIVWSLPVAMLVGELAAALPEEGGYYAWVRRGLGPFWGTQAAWLSLATSFFDMAIYPTLFVTYLGRIWPAFLDTTAGHGGWWMGVAVIIGCSVWNLAGSRAVGVGAIALGTALLAPFVALVAIAILGIARGGGATLAESLRQPAPSGCDGAWSAGLFLCMWNYMGWDNASTVASEVRDPQRTYPRTMFLTLIAVVACYALPMVAAASTGLPAREWTTGHWVEVARVLGGRWLAWGVVLGGAISALGMFNALVMSYSRLPVAMARDGILPAFLARRDERTGAPRAAIVCATVLYIACLGLGLRRLVEIDVVLYGSWLALEFIALVALRVREPDLPRPFRIPGGNFGAGAIALPPLALLAIAGWSGRHEPGVGGLSSMQLALAIAVAGAVLYLARALLLRRKA